MSTDPTGWFDPLYVAAAQGKRVVPWDRGAPHPALLEWAQAGRVPTARGPALIVGCGLGEDAEFIASLGFETTAFDVAPAAIRGARERFPESPVAYRVADLLDPPAEFSGAFAFVFESMTVQSLPDPPRAEAIANVSPFAAPGGTLLVIATARDDGTVADGPPWPLVRAEVEAFGRGGDLVPVAIERLDAHWRAEFRRAAVAPA